MPIWIINLYHSPEQLDEVVVSINKSASLNYEQLFMFGYILVAAIFIVRFLMQLFKIYSIIKSHPSSREGKLVFVYDSHLPVSSFLNFIFIPNQNVDSFLIKHELEHVRLKHSWDIIYLRIIQSLFWFNLPVIFIEKYLKLVHEFQADLVGKEAQPHYFELMLHHQFFRLENQLMHSFSNHPLKLRIDMLQKSKPLNWLNKSMLVACLLGISATGIWAQSKKVSSSEVSKEASKNKDESNPDKDGVYKKVDEGASPIIDLSDYLSRNLNFPETLRIDSISAKVVVKFIVSETGEIGNAKVVKASGFLKGEPLNESDLMHFNNEAVRVINSMPKWKPAKVDKKAVKSYFVIPILFKA